MALSTKRSNSGSRARRAKKNQALARKKFVDSYLNCDPSFGPLNLGGTSVPREVKPAAKAIKRRIDKVDKKKKIMDLSEYACLLSGCSYNSDSYVDRYNHLVHQRKPHHGLSKNIAIKIQQEWLRMNMQVRKDLGSSTVPKRSESHPAFPSASEKHSNIISREELRQSAQIHHIISREERRQSAEIPHIISREERRQSAQIHCHRENWYVGTRIINALVTNKLIICTNHYF